MTTKPTEAARIVVGVDGSAQSKLALRWAARFAAAEGAQVEAVTAWDFPQTYGWPGWPADWDPANDAHKMLNQTVDDAFAENRPLNMQLIVQKGGAARVLLQRAKDATMLVVGSRGHGGFSGLLLGSVSANVAEHAHCPVLVVHGDNVLPEVAS